MHLNDRLLKIDEVVAMVALSESSIYRKMERGEFPHPIKVGVRAVRWWLSEIVEWLAGVRAPGATWATLATRQTTIGRTSPQDPCRGVSSCVASQVYRARACRRTGARELQRATR